MLLLGSYNHFSSLMLLSYLNSKGFLDLTGTVAGVYVGMDSGMQKI